MGFKEQIGAGFGRILFGSPGVMPEWYKRSGELDTTMRKSRFLTASVRDLVAIIVDMYKDVARILLGVQQGRVVKPLLFNCS